MAPNQNDVAREAGVSNATVSRVLNNHPSIAEPTRKRVLAAMERLNYTPNSAARQLALRRSESIGVVITQVASGFFASVMKGISEAAQTKQYSTVFTVATMEDRQRAIYQSMIEKMTADGLIILEPWISDECIADLEKLSGPAVLIQRHTENPKVSSVAIDNRAAARAGMEYLLGKGHETILVVRGPELTHDGRERAEGCQDAVDEFGGSRTVSYIDGFFHPDRAVEAYQKYRENNDHPRAIFALNDAMAIAIMKQLHLEGVRIPEDVAIMGFDGIDAAEYFDLTTIVTPMEELGNKAVEILLNRLEDPESAAEHVRLDGQLTLRTSA